VATRGSGANRKKRRGGKKIVGVGEGREGHDRQKNVRLNSTKKRARDAVCGVKGPDRRREQHTRGGEIPIDSRRKRRGRGGGKRIGGTSQRVTSQFNTKQEKIAAGVEKQNALIPRKKRWRREDEEKQLKSEAPIGVMVTPSTGGGATKIYLGIWGLGGIGEREGIEGRDKANRDKERTC